MELEIKEEYLEFMTSDEFSLTPFPAPNQEHSFLPSSDYTPLGLGMTSFESITPFLMSGQHSDNPTFTTNEKQTTTIPQPQLQQQLSQPPQQQNDVLNILTSTVSKQSEQQQQQQPNPTQTPFMAHMAPVQLQQQQQFTYMYGNVNTNGKGQTMSVPMFPLTQKIAGVQQQPALFNPLQIQAQLLEFAKTKNLRAEETDMMDIMQHMLPGAGAYGYGSNGTNGYGSNGTVIVNNNNSNSGMTATPGSTVSAVTPPTATTTTPPTPTWDTANISAALANLPPPVHTSTSNNIIRLTEGFNVPQHEKQPGGRDNTRKSLPKQVIELNPQNLPSTSNDPRQLVVRASICGYDRLTRDRKVLGTMAETKFTETGSGIMKRWLAEFNSLICKFASHNNGQRLRVRFALYHNQNMITYIDSEEFETITKRGEEKKNEREKQKRKRTEHTSQPTVHSVEPPMGFTTGGTPVKVVGSGFLQSPLSSISVRFGDRDSPDVHSVKRNIIVCDVPKSDVVGEVAVNVSFDNRMSFIPSEATYTYIDPSDANGVQLMIQQMMRGNYGSNVSPPPDNSPPQYYQMGVHQMTGGNGGPMMEGEHAPVDNGEGSLRSWIENKEVDACGFNIVHYAAARGHVEMMYYLLEDQLLGVDDTDNYGRTPLFWAFWSNKPIICALLLRNNADLLACDDVSDTPLHIAVERNSLRAVKHVCFWLFKYDDVAKSKTRLVRDAITKMKNADGDTPLSLAESFEEQEMFTLLNCLLNICEERLQENTIQLHDITLRSGSHNGKSVSDIESSKLTLELSTDAFHLNIEHTERPTVIRARISFEQIAFIILDNSKTQQCRAEITLHSSPTVELFERSSLDDDAPRGTPQPEHFLSSSLSFYALMDAASIERINTFIKETNILFGFRPYCFCYRPTDSTTTTTTTVTTTATAADPKLKTVTNGSDSAKAKQLSSNVGSQKAAHRKHVATKHHILAKLQHSAAKDGLAELKTTTVSSTTQTAETNVQRLAETN